MSHIQIIGWVKEAISIGENRNDLDSRLLKEALEILESINDKDTTQKIHETLSELQKIAEFTESVESHEKALLQRASIIKSLYQTFHNLEKVQREIYKHRDKITQEQFLQYYDTIARTYRTLRTYEENLLHDEEIINKIFIELNKLVKKTVLTVQRKYAHISKHVNLTVNEHELFRDITRRTKSITTQEKEISETIKGIKVELRRLGRHYNRHNDDAETFEKKDIPQFLKDTHDDIKRLHHKITPEFFKKSEEQAESYKHICDMIANNSGIVQEIFNTIDAHKKNQDIDFSKHQFTYTGRSNIPVQGEQTNTSENNDSDYATASFNQNHSDLPSFDLSSSEQSSQSQRDEQPVESEDVTHLFEESEQEKARLAAEKEVDKTLKARIRDLVSKLDEDDTTITNLKQKIQELQSKTTDQEWIKQMQQYLDDVENSVTHMKNQNNERSQLERYDTYLEEKEKISALIDELGKKSNGERYKALRQINNIFEDKITSTTKLKLLYEFTLNLDKYATSKEKLRDEKLSDETRKNLQKEKAELETKLSSNKYSQIFNKKFMSYTISQTYKIKTKIELIISNRQFSFDNYTKYFQAIKELNSLYEGYEKEHGEKPGETANKILKINADIREHEAKIRDYLTELKQLLVQKSQQ